MHNERPGTYELQQVYDGIHKRFYVILDQPAKFIQWTAPEPAVKQRAIIDVYNSLIAMTVLKNVDWLILQKSLIVQMK